MKATKAYTTCTTSSECKLKVNLGIDEGEERSDKERKKTLMKTREYKYSSLDKCVYSLHSYTIQGRLLYRLIKYRFPSFTLYDPFKSCITVSFCIV